jgi:aspartate/methionine/tyrosine aminotransferase
VLAVKLDGATKEIFAWGFRVGFLSFAAGGNGNLDAVHAALEKKTMGSIRGGISNSPNPTQSAVARLLQAETMAVERKEKRDLLCARAIKTGEVARRPEYAEAWDVYPFNSGYFMCVKLKGGVGAEALRVHLLEEYQGGVIASGQSDVRVAFSCLEEGQIEEVFDSLHKAWNDLK